MHRSPLVLLNREEGALTLLSWALAASKRRRASIDPVHNEQLIPTLHGDFLVGEEHRVLDIPSWGNRSQP